MAKKFSIKTKESRGFRLLRWIASKVKKRPEFVYLGDKIPDKCIIIANHAGAKGAFTYRTFMDKRFMTWGAHQMCEGYKSRRKYLYHVFYRQKLGYSKFKAFMLSWSFGLISGIVYKLAGIIPVYYDLNIVKTFRYSFECLNKDMPVLVFPENSSRGYDDVIEQFYPGFVGLSQLYFNRFGQDLPIYILYFSRQHNKLVVGQPLYLQQVKQQCQTEQQTLDVFRNSMNSLYTDFLCKGDN